MDGRLPTNENIICRSSIKNMVKAGLNQADLFNNPSYQISYRRKLSRYENFMALLNLFLISPRSSIERQLDYAAYLLDPFSKVPDRHHIVRAMTKSKMYHKNNKNFRGFLLLSDLDDMTEVDQAIENLVSTVRFLVSPPESFDDYCCFQKYLDHFLLETIEYVSKPSTLEAYLTEVGFRIERSVYGESRNGFY